MVVLKYFRIIAVVEALSWLALIVATIVKYSADAPMGVHILGPRASDLIAEAALAIEFGSSAEDMARTCHAHPTLPEAVKEAALGVAGRSIHI